MDPTPPIVCLTKSSKAIILIYMEKYLTYNPKTKNYQLQTGPM